MFAVYLLVGIYGLCVGSFLNVVIYRLPRGMNLAKPGSHCTTCDYALKWYDNIPVLSYLLLGGKCRKCGSRISFRYTAVELLNTALWLLAAVYFWQTSPMYAIAVMLAASLLLCIAFIDLETMYIHDILVLFLLVPIVLAALSDCGVSLLSRLIGLAVGGGGFALIYLSAKVLLKKEGMGFGDVLLMAAVGAFLGWKATLFAVFVGSLFGCLVLLPLRLLRRDGQREFPFAPFLVVGTLAAMFFAERALAWYVGLFTI